MTLRSIRHAIGLSLLVICLKSALLQAAPPITNFIPQALSDAVEEGNAAYARKDYAVARKAYERVLKLDVSNLMGLVNLGLVESALGNKAKAEETLKKAISIRLETAPAWLALGMMYMDEDRSDAALAALSQAALYDPKKRPHAKLPWCRHRSSWLDRRSSDRTSPSCRARSLLYRRSLQSRCFLPSGKSSRHRTCPSPLFQSPRTWS